MTVDYYNTGARRKMKYRPIPRMALNISLGLLPKPGRYGGTFAQKDIAFEFVSWISAEFKLFLIANNGLEQNEWFTKLTQIAISQMKNPVTDHRIVRLEKDSSR